MFHTLFKIQLKGRVIQCGVPCLPPDGTWHLPAGSTACPSPFVDRASINRTRFPLRSMKDLAITFVTSQADSPIAITCFTIRAATGNPQNFSLAFPTETIQDKVIRLIQHILHQCIRHRPIRADRIPVHLIRIISRPMSSYCVRKNTPRTGSSFRVM